MHKYLKPSQPAVSNSKLETDTAPGVNHNSSGTLGSSDLTLMKTLPPAGSLIVHDKGKKKAHIIIKVYFSLGSAVYAA